MRGCVEGEPVNETHYKHLGMAQKSRRGEWACGAQRIIHPSHPRRADHG
jgi:hypothetical protein